MASFWPEPVEYAEAVQTPRTSFDDPELQAAAAEMGMLGPFVCSGGFASVYHLIAADGQRSWAVKCFTRQVAGQRERYRRISEHLDAARLECAVNFQYQDMGIRIRGQWFPILKMDWVDGLTLSAFVDQNVEDHRYIGRLYSLWLRLEPYLRETQTIHGDLQHGNVLLVPGQTQGRLSLRLIDYDGLWTPELAGTPSGEAGHAAYQHPDRQRRGLYSPEMDRFPHLVIAAALRCLSHPNQADLWRRHQNGDNLMFTRSDFEKPQSSALLHELWTSRIPELQSWAGLIALCATASVEATPRLKERLVDGKLPSLPADELARAREILGPQPATRCSAERTEPETSAEDNWWERPRDDAETTSPRDAAVKSRTDFLPPKTRGTLTPRPGVGDVPAGRNVDRVFLAAAGGIVGLALLLGLFVVLGGKQNGTPRPSTGNAETKLIGPEEKPTVLEPNEIESKSTGMKLAWIPAATFQMGSPSTEDGRANHGGPQHTVRVSPFYMGQYEVTQGEYRNVMGRNPSRLSSASGLDVTKFPVESVSWFDAIEFCNTLSVADGLTPHYRISGIERLAGQSINAATVELMGGTGYRLPTEAEWEYACRAGTATPFHFGSVLNGDQANVDRNIPYGTTTKGKYLNRTTTVGSYDANAFDLFDMHGNVYEWCFDVYDESSYKNRSGTTVDPQIMVGSQRRVLRGGSWYTYAWVSRTALRSRSATVKRVHDVGFRVVSVGVRQPGF